MAIQDLELTPQQAVPVPVVQGGIRRGEDQSAAQEVLLLVDFSEREDLRRVMDEHRSMPHGDVSSAWSRPIDRPDLVWLILHFVQPVETVAIFEFDVASQGKLVDVLVQHSYVTLLPGGPDDELDELAKKEHPSLRVEVAAEFGKQWDGVWAEAIATGDSVSLEAAAQIIQYERADTNLRVLFPDSPPVEKIVDLFRHPSKDALVFVTDDMLINQIKRENPKIAESFDAHFDAELRMLSRDLSQTAGLVGHGVIEEPESTEKKLVGALLSNALNGVSAAVELTRLGYRLQPAATLRVATAATAVAIQLTLDGNKVSDFLTGKLKSTEAIGPAKKVVPFIGRLYGYLSELFTHIGPLFGEIQPNVPYDANNGVVARTNLLSAQLVLLVVGIAAEIAFFDYVKVPRYWRKAGPDAFELALRPDVEQTIDDLFDRLSIAEDAEQPN